MRRGLKRPDSMHFVKKTIFHNKMKRVILRIFLEDGIFKCLHTELCLQLSILLRALALRKILIEP